MERINFNDYKIIKAYGTLKLRLIIHDPLKTKEYRKVWHGVANDTSLVLEFFDQDDKKRLLNQWRTKLE